MNFELSSDPLETIDAQAAVLVLFELNGANPGEGLTGPVVDLITELYARKEFTGKFLSTALVHRPEGFRAGRLLLVGGGKESEFDLNRLRRASGAAVRRLRGIDKPSVALLPPGKNAGALEVQALVEGAILADYRVDNYKTAEADSAVIGKVLLCADADAESGIARGRAVAESQNFARGLVNEPGNVLTPIELAARASVMAQETGLAIEILEQEQMAALNMNALLGVAQGSDNPPTLMVVKYRPEGAPEAPHIGLVGKAVTFDTGGISIKPAKDMDQMKYDMAGGAAMLGAIRAISQLKPGIAVTAIVPSVENMPSARAQRPGDIVTTMSGKTVEVLNTDAEGRLILADALTYAQQQGCTHLVDAATLTGSIVVALGHVRVGAFSNDEKWQSTFLASADSAGEKMWAMPLDDEYKEQLNSPIADIPNIGTRWGGSITAALFLKEFADPLPWVHLDIAGTAWLEEKRPDLPKGPSGVGVRTLIDLAMRMQS
jgi:leucyl aminopeptidase